MFRLLRDLRLAYGACSKYNVGLIIRWIPTGDGSYLSGTTADGRKVSDRPYIVWCPFDRNALAIFFHELGHHIDAKHHRSHREVKRIVNIDVYNLGGLFLQGKSVYRHLSFVMHEEANASQYALRALRAVKASSPSNRSFLWKCFVTYSAVFYNHFRKQEDVLAITNIVNSCNAKIINRR